ncbi:ABC transporter permease [Herbiconiux daphne]|uniref:ABC transporter permease n=1 Tax=Herbiconiux daphne TaxID=2970914 RepID=A0ABT2H2X1_9MICO|nr:ABC transporter permease [Herbiconiux daphne]MCS5734286.1 ABC transporter permease [Herbiconiux daphne]
MTAIGAFLRGVGLIVSLELKQRVRGVAWYVILGVFFGLVAVVTVGVWVVTGTWGGSGGGLFSSVVYFVLLLASLISPALSGNAINGEREGGTLATIQVTTITTGQIVIGKWLAAWVASLALLVVTVPFLAIAVGIGEVSAATVVSSLAVLAAELGVLAALGVGLSGVIRKPLFSVVVTYLTVAALSIGTLIAFAIAGTVTQVQVTQTTVDFDYSTTTDEGTIAECAPPTTTTYSVPRFDLYWGVLVANPYVVVADASYGDFTRDGQPNDLFGYIAYGVRQAQVAPETERFDDYCHLAPGEYFGQDQPTPEEVLRSGVPSWFIGLSIQAVLAAAALFAAWRLTRTPSGRLAKGSRIA